MKKSALSLAAVGLSVLLAPCASGQGCEGPLFQTESFHVFAFVEPQTTMAWGDFDGDGDLDVMTGGWDSSYHVLQNNGDGTFQLLTSGYMPEPTDMAIGDFDGDGDLDVATSSYDYIDVRLFFNNGDGTFGPAAIYNLAQSCGALAAGDFDQDGSLDIALATAASGSEDGIVGVLANNGDGTFVLEGSYAIGVLPIAIGAEDLDGDGSPDLAVANLGGDDLSVLLNHGDGTFAPQARYQAGLLPRAIAIADLDADGSPDLVVANLFSEISVILNVGDGTFAPRVSYPWTTCGKDVALGDLDLDGDMDIARLSGCVGGPYEVKVGRGRGDGTFAPPEPYGIGEVVDQAFSLALGDLDGNGALDVAITLDGGPTGMCVLLSVCGVQPCNPADFALPFGVLDIFDVQLFLNHYAAHSLQADVNSDGELDFFDVQVYLNAFAAGCPD